MRILLTFLMYPRARPTPKYMKSWVDGVHYCRQHVTRGGESSIFNYIELSMWSCGFLGQ